MIAPNILCYIVYLTVLAFFFIKFKQKHLNWWILLCPLMFGMALDIVRKDYIIYLFSIAIIYLASKNPINSWKYIAISLMVILGLFIHEAFIFYIVPLAILMVWHNSHTRILPLLLIFFALMTFGLLAVYKGDTLIADKIIESWNTLSGKELITSKDNSIGSIGWKTMYAISYHLHRNFNCIGFGWFGIIYQPVVMIIVYYFAMNYTATFTRNENEASSRRLAISATYLFLFISMLPLFLLFSCDYGRLYQSLLAISYAVFLILPIDSILNLFPKWYLKFVNILNTSLNKIIIPSKGLMTLMLVFVAVNPYDFNPAGAIRMSVIYTDFHWIATILHHLKDFI